MKAVTVREMRSLESLAGRHGWPEERLLREAGQRLGDALSALFPQPGTVVGYLGKGHNAGDALVAMVTMARRHGWQLVLRPGFAPEECAPLTRVVWEETGFAASAEKPDWRALPRPLVLLDGLLGIGATGAIRPPLVVLAEEMAWLRQNAGAVVTAVDGPSGVDCDTGEAGPGAVVADYTFMIGAPKVGLLPEAAANHTGALVLVPVDPLAPTAGDGLAMTAPGSLHPVQMPRPFNFHKGLAGRLALLVGSADYPGSAILAATGALRGGAGYAVVYTPPEAVAAVAAKCPPEVIVRPCRDAMEVLDGKPDALVIGPGLGNPPAVTGLAKLLETGEIPAVVDADALNFLARDGNERLLRANHLLTPHPGEFARLAPDLAGAGREEAARAFVARYPATLLLKGCRTLIASGGSDTLWCNPTGTPGMATGGQGDVLSGVIGARLAIGDDLVTAAAFASWLCGRAGEFAQQHAVHAAESLTPSDGLAHLGAAFRDWCERKR